MQGKCEDLKWTLKNNILTFSPSKPLSNFQYSTLAGTLKELKALGIDSKKLTVEFEPDIHVFGNADTLFSYLNLYKLDLTNLDCSSVREASFMFFKSNIDILDLGDNTFYGLDGSTSMFAFANIPEITGTLMLDSNMWGTFSGFSTNTLDLSKCVFKPKLDHHHCFRRTKVKKLILPKVTKLNGVIFHEDNEFEEIQVESRDDLETWIEAGLEWW